MTTKLKFKNQSSKKHEFHSWTKSTYDDSVQPIREFIDNSIAAGSSQIYIDIDFTTNQGSIEDDGCGFPIDPEGLERCFTCGNGGENTTDLNEHGEGFNRSIAKLDPTDSKWNVYWKRESVCYKLITSFMSEEHFVEIGGDWLGCLNGKSGSLVMFPINVKGFKSLFDTPDPKLKDIDDILRRLRISYAHTWMFHPNVQSKRVRIYLNGIEIEPFKMPDTYHIYTKLPEKVSKTLSSGCKIDVSMYILNKDIENSWFKKTGSSTGFYFNKNGRFIESYNQNALYTRLYGSKHHNSHNGFICLVNIVGKQKDTPPTIPTKNKFDPNNDIFIEACEWIKDEVVKYVGNPPNTTEESLMERFINDRKKQHEYPGSKHNIKPKYILQSPDGTMKTPQLDAYETLHGYKYIYEAKRANIVEIQNINQLHCNWVFACKALGTSENAFPILLIDVSLTSFNLSDDLKYKIKTLAEHCDYGFPIIIKNYQLDTLYEFKK